MREAVLDTARILERLGHEVEEAYPARMLEPRCLEAFFDALSVTAAQSVEALTRELGEEPGPDDLDPVTWLWVRRGREITGLELADALVWQNGLRAAMAHWWQGFDLLLSPVFATPPGPVGWPWREPDGLQKSVDVLTFTAPFNTTGRPAIAVPAALTESGEPSASSRRRPTDGRTCWCPWPRCWRRSAPGRHIGPRFPGREDVALLGGVVQSARARR
ncbi:hypothetical protein GCM10017744_081750 [Streptomyces antimycoticus]|uniref:Amidase domain-containing protein n=1 Tax=Streptomyces antimycoticus TaxID=68175 RepID=A0A4D4K382_9ACTN|nr:hypothetical protein SANT12839_019600 [Streptomyces antimycoticus]